MAKAQLQKLARWRQNLPTWAGPSFIILLLLLSLIGGWLVRAMTQTLLDSVVRYIWNGWLYLRGLPQEEVWGYTAVIALLHFVWLLNKGVSMPTLASRPVQPMGVVQGWLQALKMNADPEQLGKVPLSRLQKVTLAVLHQRQGQSMKRLRAKLRAGTLPVTDDLQTFLQTGRSPTPNEAVTQSAVRSPAMARLLDFLEEK